MKQVTFILNASQQCQFLSYEVHNGSLL